MTTTSATISDVIRQQRGSFKMGKSSYCLADGTIIRFSNAAGTWERYSGSNLVENGTGTASLRAHLNPPPTASEMIDSEITMVSRYRVAPDKQRSILADVRRVARRLADLAAEIERRADRAEVEIGLTPIPEGYPHAGELANEPRALDRIATDVQHDVLWAVANLSLDRLAHDVQDYATQRAELDAYVLARVLPAMDPFIRAHDAATKEA